MKNKENMLYLFIIVVLTFATIFFLFRTKTTEVVYDYNESSKAEYTVCLKENNLFADTCIGEDKQYLSTLTNEIRMTLHYQRINNVKRDTDFDYYVVSRVYINNASNEREIFSKEKELIGKKNYKKSNQDVDIIQETVVINFDEYNDIINEQLKKYSLTAKSALQVSLVIVENNNEKTVSSITIPLTEQTYSISKQVLEDNNEVDNVEKNNFIFVAVLFGLLDLFLIVILVLRIINSKHNSKFEYQVNQLLNEYDKVIVEVQNESINYDNKQIIRVSKFGELVDVRDNIEKPILYINRDIKNRDFVVQDKDIIYIFTMCDINSEERSNKE